jgi:hypothetical protein
MKNDITLGMLEELVHALPTAHALGKGHDIASAATITDKMMRNLIGSNPAPETPEEIAKLGHALTLLSPDVGRGHGTFYDSNGVPLENNWLAVIWSIRGLNWFQGRSISKDWSKLASERYTDEGFEEAWNSYDPTHPNPVGIGSLYMRAAELGLRNLEAPALNPSRYKLIGSQQLLLFPPLNWVIKGILPATGLAAIFGPSASGKSFLALDAAAAIANGAPWFGHRTQIAPVIYIALEGEAGYRSRVLAWEREHGQPLHTQMSFLMQSFKINDPQDVADLIAVAPQGSVIFIDTLNRAAPTADENSSRDMGEILEGAKALQAATNGLVVLIHHTGKDASKGARGHSSFFAALDGAVSVDRGAPGRSWSVAKAKDGEDGLSYPFRLKHHVLGVDSDGDEISSCTVERDLGGVFSQPKPKGKSQQSALKAIKNAIRAATDVGRGGCSPATRCLNAEIAVLSIVATIGHVQQNKRNNRARTLLDDLVKGGYMGSGLEGDDGWVWLTSD